jgi:O-antigen ligase
MANRRHEITSGFDDRDEPTRFASAIVLLLVLCPILGVIAYGAVDRWAVGSFALFAAVVAALWAGDAFSSKRLRLSGSPLQLPLIGLIAIGLVQLFPLGGPAAPDGLFVVEPVRSLSLDPYSTRFFVIWLVIYLTFFSATLTFLGKERQLKRISTVLIVFGAAMAFFAILQRLADTEGIFGLRETPQAIPFGTYVNQHHFAALMAMISGLALGLLFGKGVGRDKKLLLWIAIFLMGLAILFTSSRGGFLCYVGVVVFCLAAVRFSGRDRESKPALRQANGTKRLSLVMGAATILLLFAGLAAFLGAGEGLLRGIGAAEPDADVTSGRSHFWRTGVQIFLDNPIIGTGFDSFGVAYTRYDTRSGFFRVEQAHNDYLQVLTDSGLLGFACIAGFIFLLFRLGLRRLAESKAGFERAILTGAFAGCFGILIHSFFDFPLRTPANGFVFLLLAAIAVTTLKKETSVA